MYACIRRDEMVTSNFPLHSTDTAYIRNVYCSDCQGGQELCVNKCMQNTEFLGIYWGSCGTKLVRQS
jgi:hypothetical protein